MKAFNTIVSIGLLLGWVLALVPAAACHKKFESGLPVILLSAGGREVRAEVAQAPEARATGLMFRHELGRDCGMLFVFEDAQPLSFWMKNTYVPLSIAFLDGKGVILNIEDMRPLSEDAHRSKGPARYALEMNLGWFRDAGVTAGMRVEGIPAPAP